MGSDHFGTNVANAHTRLEGVVSRVTKGNDKGLDTMLLAIDNELGKHDTSTRNEERERERERER